MTTEVVDFDQIREKFMGYEFPIVPAHLATEETRQSWANSRGRWIDSMLDPTAAVGVEVEFYSDQVAATIAAFGDSIALQTSCFGLIRDETTEREAFDNTWSEFFPDELFVNVRKLPSVFQALVVAPSVLIRNYQLSMDRVIPEPSTIEIRSI